MKKQDCKHNQVREKLKNKGQYGKHNVYCTQCQRWVDIEVVKDVNRFKAGVPQDDD